MGKGQRRKIKDKGTMGLRRLLLHNSFEASGNNCPTG
jgi:hypothetical protein